jgi:hypothetical protein
MSSDVDRRVSESSTFFPDSDPVSIDRYLTIDVIFIRADTETAERHTFKDPESFCIAAGLDTLDFVLPVDEYRKKDTR